MSVAELRADARFFRSELWLVFGRRRNWAGLAVLAAVPIVIAVAVRVANPAEGADAGPNFFASITSSGFFVALAALGVSLPLFLPLAVSAIAGDAVAGEAHSGTLRYLLAVPVPRTRLLVIKYATIVVFGFAATGLVAVVGLAAGFVLFGAGEVTLLSGNTVGLDQGLLRLLAIWAYLAVGLAALGAVGLFVSTLTEQPIGATIAVVIFTITSHILYAIPQLGWLHPYLLTRWWMSFADLLREPIYTEAVGNGLVSAGAYILIFWTAAWARFASRDVTS